MNPIFIAHLVADFLFQPTWLVKWKKRSSKGIIVHASIHAAILAVLVIPQTFLAAAIILIIALTHGIIDHIKISLPKKSFEPAFLFDQVIHAAILLFAMRFLPFNQNFWNSENGVLLAALLVFFSFGIGLWNLIHIKNYPVQTIQQKTVRISTIILVFLLYGGATILAAKS